MSVTLPTNKGAIALADAAMEALTIMLERDDLSNDSRYRLCECVLDITKVQSEFAEKEKNSHRLRLA